MEHYVIKPAGEAGEAAVHAGLRAYNRTFVSDTADLSLVVEDEAGQIIGGCDAFRMGELALLDVLWVAESRRGTGLGACLLAQLEQDAARQGAKRLELNTFGFQDPSYSRIAFADELASWWPGVPHHPGHHRRGKLVGRGSRHAHFPGKAGAGHMLYFPQAPAGEAASSPTRRWPP